MSEVWVTDEALLAEYGRNRSADAFAELVRRYAVLVYGTCLRVTGSRDDADDLTQECFLHLAQQTAAVRHSLPGWLHSMARTRAINCIRNNTTRRRHEQHAAEIAPGQTHDWQRISQLIDEAIAALPAEFAEPIVRHYLQGHTQEQIATQLGVNQATISRRLQRGIELLRDKLGSAALTAPLLMGHLEQYARPAVPDSVAQSLNKIALAGIGPGAFRPARLGLGIGVVALVMLALIGVATVLVTNRDVNMNKPPQVNSQNRVVLQNVPRIGFEINTCPFVGVMASITEYMGPPYSHDYLMGVSGAAFRRAWNRDDGGNVDLMYFGTDVIRRTFDAVGLEHRIVPRGNRDQILQAIRQSLAQNRPVIMFGVVGPPEADLVFGYDNGGDVLIGYSYFPPMSVGPFQQADWFSGLDANRPGAIVIGGTKTRPSEIDILIASLKWAIDLERTARREGFPNHVFGLKAITAWADALEIDADYPADDAKTLQTRAMVHADQATMQHERSHAAAYLRQMAAEVPQVAVELNAAADLYAQTADVSKIYPWRVMWDSPVVQQGLADPATRRAMAQQIRAAAALEAKAVDHLEAALVKLQAAAGDVP